MFDDRTKLTNAVIAAIALACLTATPADARRGGSFGSRGSRTFEAPRQTTITPRDIAPIQRSMTQPSANGAVPSGSQWHSQNNGTPNFAQPRPASRFGGFGGGLVGGLIAGGLIGTLMGHGGGWGMGYGGMGGGMLISLFQLLLVGGLIWLVIGFFRRRAGSSEASFRPQNISQFAGNQPGPAPSFGGYMAQPQPAVELAITDSDKEDFERLLNDVQDAFGREDYGRLRELTTPEIMSYLSEELSQNATSGRRNEVSATRLIDAEVSEAWQEGNFEYATIAMRYESIDVMRDRNSGEIVLGDPRTPSQTSELWTFVRPVSGTWKLSAIQE